MKNEGGSIRWKIRLNFKINQLCRQLMSPHSFNTIVLEQKQQLSMLRSISSVPVGPPGWKHSPPLVFIRIMAPPFKGVSVIYSPCRPLNTHWPLTKRNNSKRTRRRQIILRFSCSYAGNTFRETGSSPQKLHDLLELSWSVALSSGDYLCSFSNQRSTPN